MSWSQHHQRSERLAADAEEALRASRRTEADACFRAAGAAEREALQSLPPKKPRTRSITAVSAAALFYKGQDFATAKHLAYTTLAAGDLLPFAVEEMEELLQTIRGEEAIAASGLQFSRQDVRVSVRGGQVVTGGAPLDLILRKVEEVRAIFYRTIEFLMERPHRRRGGPAADIQHLFQPWLFQAPTGSYQFAVRLKSPEQLEFGFGGRLPEVEEVTRKFIEIVRASATDPDEALTATVPDDAYRETFLRLTRELAPTDKSRYGELRLSSGLTAGDTPVTFAPPDRERIGERLRLARGPVNGETETMEVIHLKGVLRAVHLDKDWLELIVPDRGEVPIRVERTGEIIDDLIGPMVNHQVRVDAYKTKSGVFHFKDITSDE